MDTRSFTAALVALALLTGCAPNQSAPANGNPSAQGQAPNPGQGPGGPAQGQGQPGAGAGGFSGQGGAPGAGGGGFPGQGGAPGAGGAPGGRAGGRQAVVTVQTEVVKAGVLWVDNTTAGAVVPETQSTVAAGASGTVKTILRQVGDWVEPGTPVVQLDDTQLKLSARLAQATLDNAKINAGTADGGAGNPSKLGLQVQSAQSALASAQKNFASAQALAKVGGISGSDLDNAQTQLQNAQANLESARMSLAQSGLQVETASIQLQQAQLNLANATIKAPYAGQISAINLHPGEFVGTSTAAFSLVSRTKVISFGVSPSEAPGLSFGSPVTFRYAGKTADTRVTQAPSAPVNGLVPLTAALPSMVDAPLGTVGTLLYRLAAAEGVLVPLPALQSAENKTFVYTADKGKARRFEVTVLGDSGTYTAVSGLPSGSTVIVNPPPGLLVGASVQPVAQDGSAPVAGAGAGAAGQGQWSGQKRTAGSGTAPGAAEAGSGTQAPAAGNGQWSGQRRQQAAGAPGADPAAQTPAAGNGQWSGQRRQQAAGTDGAVPAGDPTQAPPAGQRRRPAAGADSGIAPAGDVTQTPGTGQRRRPADAAAGAAGSAAPAPAPTSGGQ